MNAMESKKHSAVGTNHADLRKEVDIEYARRQAEWLLNLDLKKGEKPIRLSDS